MLLDGKDQSTVTPAEPRGPAWLSGSSSPALRALQGAPWAHPSVGSGHPGSLLRGRTLRWGDERQQPCGVRPQLPQSIGLAPVHKEVTKRIKLELVPV